MCPKKLQLAQIPLNKSTKDIISEPGKPLASKNLTVTRIRTKE